MLGPNALYDFRTTYQCESFRDLIVTIEAHKQKTYHLSIDENEGIICN